MEQGQCREDGPFGSYRLDRAGGQATPLRERAGMSPGRDLFGPDRIVCLDGVADSVYDQLWLGQAVGAHRQGRQAPFPEPFFSAGASGRPLRTRVCAGRGRTYMLGRLRDASGRGGLRAGLLLAVAGGLVVLSVGVATAAAGNGNGGNSGNAKLCQKDGWQSLYTSTGGFSSEDECVAYAAQGGTLETTPPPPPDLCAYYGGTYSTDPSTDGFLLQASTVLWTCNGWPFTSTDLSSKLNALTTDCTDYSGGNAYAYGGGTSAEDFTCYYYNG